MPAPRRRASRPHILIIPAVLAALLVAFAGDASAQQAASSLPSRGAGAPALPVREAHGWGVIPTGPNHKPTLIHLPPRDGVGASGGVPRGSVRTAAWLSESPEALASWDSRVYLVFPRTHIPDPAAPRRVMMASAQRIIAGVWETSPAGRLRVLPALPGDGSLVGFTASAAGPAALIHAPSAPASGSAPWRLLALDGQRWLDLPIPPECVEDLGPDPALVGTETGLVLMTSTGPRASMWEICTLAPGQLPADVEPAADAASLWRRHKLNWGAAPAGGRILAIGGRLIRLREDGGRFTLDLIRPGPGGGVFRAATLDGIPAGATALRPIALDASGTLALVWLEPAAGADPGVASPAAALKPLHIREVAALTGRTLYDGSGAGPSLVASGQFRLLAIALILVMVTVLLYILRPGAGDARRAPDLPAGVSIAEPGRRIAAGLADLLLGLIGASWIMDIETAQILGPALLGAVESGAAAGVGTREVAALGLAFIITWAHTTLGEALVGRSVGKMLVNCEVVRIPPVAAAPASAPAEGAQPADAPPSAPAALERPTFPRAALRNLVRWLLPPLAIWLFVDPVGRHPGDLLSGTAVIVRRPVLPGPEAGRRE